MPRKTKKEWKHPLYAIGYCYERYGRVYLRVKDKKKATHLNWLEENKEEAIELLGYYINSQIYDIKEEFTIYYVIPKFLEHIKNTTSERNYNSYVLAFSRLIKEDFPLTDTILIREHIQNNFNVFQKDKKHNTAVNIINKVKSLFIFAIDNEYMIKNPISNAMTLNFVKSEHYTPTLTEFELMLNQIQLNSKHINLYYMLQFLKTTGMRISEAVSLKWVDILDNHIKIYGKKVSVKENKIRYFPLDPFPELVELLNEIKKHNFTNELVFGNFKYLYKTKVINKYCDYLGIKQFQFHAIRRLAIECWKQEGINRADRAILAGHDENVQKAKYELNENIVALSNRILKQKK